MVIKSIKEADDRESVTLEDFYTLEDIGGIDGKIHSLISYDLDDHLILFDD